MQWIYRLTIDRKVTLIITVTAVVALTIACLSFIFYDTVSVNKTMKEDLTTLSRVVGDNCAAALMFDDPETARKILSALQARPDLLIVSLYTPAGKPFAHFSPSGKLSPPERPLETFTWSTLAVTHKIVRDQEEVGSIYIEVELREYRQRVARYLGIAMLVLVVSLAAAVVMSSRLRRLITDPILSVSRITKAVSATPDYSQRIENSGGDELAGAFNEMLEHIQQRDEELLVALEKAQEASKAKSEFLANMSHEIRTPMNGILGLTKLCLNTPLTAVQKEYLRGVYGSADSLMSIINDILDFSKIEAGVLDFYPVPMNLPECLDSAMQPLTLRAHSKALELTSHIHPDVPTSLVADSVRLRQVLLNLIGNAVKFTDHGEVVVQVSLDAREQEKVTLHFAVRDTGIGIPSDKLGDIFQAFRQADASTTRQYGGTGLGLSICTRLVEMMGGKIWAESEQGQGSTFHFTAHLEVAGEQSTLAAPGSITGLNILVVDDNATNRLVLKDLLEGWKMQPTLVESAPQALALLEKAQADSRPFDLVLTDANMPGMDGFQLLEKARSRFSGVVMMMLTSSDLEGEARRARQLGATAYVTKPINHAALWQAIQAHVRNDQTAAQAVEATVDDQEWEPLKLLLVEDNEVNQTLAVLILEERGHDVTLAGNGQVALDILATRSFDLILMDLQMPILDGYQATAKIRENEFSTGGHVPIIALTAHAMKKDREICLAAGMDDYVTKPIDEKALFEAIARVLQRRSVKATEGAGPLTAANRPKMLDQEVLFARLKGRSDRLARVVTQFLQLYEQQLTEIEQALRTVDLSALKQACQRYRCSLLTFEARTLITLIDKLERCAENKEQSSAEEFMTRLRAESEFLNQDLQELLRVNFSESSRPSPAPLADPSSGKVLVAEDNPINQTMALTLLDDFGWEGVVVENGQEAVNACGKEAFAAVLMDIHMPVMDGIEAARAIRHNEKLKGGRVPIVAVTAGEVVGAALQPFLDAGMDGGLSKPIQPGELQKLLTQLTTAPAEEAPPPPVAVTVNESEKDNQVIDVKALKERVKGRVDRLIRLTDMFFRHYKEQLEQIASAVARGEASEVQRAAHKFKSSVASFDAPIAVKLTTELESRGRRAQLEGTKELVERLTVETERLRQRLEELVSDPRALET